MTPTPPVNGMPHWPPHWHHSEPSMQNDLIIERRLTLLEERHAQTGQSLGTLKQRLDRLEQRWLRLALAAALFMLSLLSNAEAEALAGALLSIARVLAAIG